MSVGAGSIKRAQSKAKTENKKELSNMPEMNNGEKEALTEVKNTAKAVEKTLGEKNVAETKPVMEDGEKKTGRTKAVTEKKAAAKTPEEKKTTAKATAASRKKPAKTVNNAAVIGATNPQVLKLVSECCHLTEELPVHLL